jgi:hypothetical protein
MPYSSFANKAFEIDIQNPFGGIHDNTIRLFDQTKAIHPAKLDIKLLAWVYLKGSHAAAQQESCHECFKIVMRKHFLTRQSACKISKHNNQNNLHGC